MRPSTTPALLPIVQRRNRLILAMVLAAMVPGLGYAGQWLFHHSGPSLPLVVIDELPAGNQSLLWSSPMSLAVPALHTASAAEPVPALKIDEEVSAINSTTEIAAPVSFDENVRWFNGRPMRPSKTLVMTVTAYSPDARSCGDSADGITASGYSVFTNGMKMAAADTRVLPFGSLISVPGYDDGHVIPVLDRGGKIKGHRLDMLHPTHDQALQWGTQKLEITVWEYADGLPHDYQPIYHADSSINGNRRVGS